jgi:hypothetical protein
MGNSCKWQKILAGRFSLAQTYLKSIKKINAPFHGIIPYAILPSCQEQICLKIENQQSSEGNRAQRPPN